MTTIWMTFIAFWTFPQSGGKWNTHSFLWLLPGKQYRVQWTQEPQNLVENFIIVGRNRSIVYSYAVCPVSKNWRKYISIVDDFWFQNQILLEVFSSIPKLTQEIFLLNYKASLGNVLFEWRTSFLRLNGFTRISLRCSFFGNRID